MGKINQDDVAILNIYVPCVRAPTFVKETLLNINSFLVPNLIIVADFCTPLSPIARSSRQKLKEEIMELTVITTQMDITDIYRLFQLKTNYTFSVSHGTFSRIDQRVAHKTSLNRLQN